MYRLRRRVLSVALAPLLLTFGAITATSVAHSPTAHAAAATLDPNGKQGMDLDDAWKLTRGSPHDVIAYVEGGVNWHLEPEARELHNHVYINWREVPLPCSKRPCHKRFGTTYHSYDRNHDGKVSAADWKHDPRVHDANHNGFIDPEDILVAFRDHKDRDHDGFADDVSGWDFYDHSPDSATLDAGYTHSDDQMLNALSQCPRCMVMPVKAGDEALDRTDDLAQAWLYAAQRHVAAIASLTADLGYSSYMKEAVQRVVRKGIAVFDSSNDFDSTDHQGGMFWPGVVPGNGALANAAGTHWVRADETSWGVHNVLSIAGQGSTSGSTAAGGGLAALLMSWGRHEYRHHKISSPLTGTEALQILERTATPITHTSLPWPGAKGDWSVQYGYGIPNLYRAMRAVSKDNISPVTEITSPDWYQLYDPVHRHHVAVSGRVTLPVPHEAWHYRLQVGLGEQPTHFRTVAHGKHRGAFTGRLGTLALHKLVPKRFATKPMTISQSKELLTAEQYAVILRLVVVDAHHDKSVERRAIYAHHDPTLMKGYPTRLSSAGESQPALADLTGQGREDIVFGTADGWIHALDPKTRHDMKGFPVHTKATIPHRQYAGVHPGFEPVLADVAVASLKGNGHQDIVATSTTGRVYAWSSKGHLLKGWPKRLATGVHKIRIPRADDAYTRKPVMGAVAAPVLAHLRDTKTLDVVQAGWDGHIHAWNPHGHSLPGWPVKTKFPRREKIPSGYVKINDHKLDATPAVAYFNGPKGKPSIVERLQYSETQGAGIDPLGYGFVDAYNANGERRFHWPVKLPSVIEYYSSAQEFITEGSSSAVSADVTGTGLFPDEIAVSPVFSLPYLVNGAGLIVGTYGTVAPGVGQLFEPGYLQSLPNLQHLPDSNVAFTTSGAFGKLGGTLRYGQAESGAASLAVAELEDNSSRGIDEFDNAWPAIGGADSPGFPGTRQGLNFLGSPIFAAVDGTGQGDLIDGGDSNAIQAYTASGREAAGFPKWTTGWDVFSPSTGDLFGNGKTELLTTTREGYLFVWKTKGRAANNNEWWRWGHDEWNSGRYGTVTRPPGTPRHLTWHPGGSHATFVAPGSSWYDGTVAAYRVRFTAHGKPKRVTATVSARHRQRIAVPAHASRVTVQAVNSAGLRGAPATVR